MGEKMADKVMRIMKNPDNIRNIAICAHIDHGKTTFSDNLLAGAGMMSEELAGKQLALDFHADEQARGITIDSASVSMVHNFSGIEYLINLIDTPGHVDFGGDVTRAMRAVDGAVVLCCAVEGIMPQTETVLRQALKERVKPILFINKVDRLMKELKLTPEMMQERFMKIIASVNRLITNIAEEGYGSKWQVNVQDGSVCFGSAFHNWALSIDYMQKKGISFKNIIDAYENNTWKELGKKAPLHEVVLNVVIKHHPNPTIAQKYRIPKIWHGDPESPLGKGLMSCDPNGPLAFVVIKVVVDPQAGEIAAGRMYSGTIKKGMPIYMNIKKTSLRAQQIYIYNGAKREIVDNVPCGNIIGLGGLKDAYPGETITDQEDEPFEKITHIFEPVITKSIEAKRPSDLPELAKILVQVSKEDPSIQIEMNKETGEYLISGMGELHLEIIENRIRDNKHLEVLTSAPIVVYRETVTKPSGQSFEGKSPNKHNKLYFKVEPLSPEIMTAIKAGKVPEGRIKKKDEELWRVLEEAGMDSKETRKVKEVFNGNMLVDGTRGIVHIGEVIEMIMDMYEDVMKAGSIAREPCTGVKVTIVDMKLHEDAIHRGPAQFYPAVRLGIRGAMNLSRPLLFEPVQTMRFEAPIEYMGEISKLIANKRGQLLDMQQEGETVIVIGKLPVGEMFGLSSELRSATGGRGISSLIDQNFEKLPEELQHKIIQQIRNRKGLKAETEESE
ncbi:MAG: elongation factor EF-2 [Nanoarchaeota archaeon]|nr:elongation factor EF-2 [Nanoarchaeota archaeon]MBU1269798.1 elongation factor EF-2 [Nanoarchaeota archaeon]MBU1604390.1 elongation factor EF-2 [Nanoarchaeota archaeon]MBU2443753.1 elongation factor EF-2 [Nanoarchaeota archaeon]